MTIIKTLMAATAALTISSAALVAPVSAAGDPAPQIYAKAMEGKRIMLVPMAMGFDLAQGWAAILKREVDAFGGIFRNPRSQLERGGRCAGHNRSHRLGKQTGRSDRHVSGYELLLQADEARPESWHLCDPRGQSGQL